MVKYFAISAPCALAGFDDVVMDSSRQITGNNADAGFRQNEA
jgi:hypothetical protein